MTNDQQSDESRQRFKLVSTASTNYRRAGARLERARKALLRAEAEFKHTKRELNLAIESVQPIMPLTTAELEAARLASEQLP